MPATPGAADWARGTRPVDARGRRMTERVVFLVIFLVTGVGFLLMNLLLGRLFRPHRPDPEKETIYECGEPTIGSAWVQFDLRFYVVALLFVIFDVEMAFFFPWALVFGKANVVARQQETVEVRNQAAHELLLPHQLAKAKEAAKSRGQD